jgi:2-iminobutanoate/2-iminopropanoate deaminase
MRLSQSKIEIEHPEKMVSTGAYSSAISIEGWLYISGQGPLDMKSGEIVLGSIEDQTRLTLSHIGKILDAAGCTFDDVVKCTCYLAEMGEFDRFNQVYAQFFPGVRPARTTIQAVLWGGIKVEIDAIARQRKER